MLQVRDIYDEKERGCGFRKAGGLYLMSGKASAPCGKLPFELTICPCCSAGIKPCRSWTWIDAAKLMRNIRCTLQTAMASQGCPDCPVGSANLQNMTHVGLLWIGEKYYPTPAKFLEEANRLGVSRRLPAIPNDFVVGETWVLYAHRKGISEVEQCVICEGDGKLAESDGGDPGGNCFNCEGLGHLQVHRRAIVGAFLPDHIEYTVKEKDDQEKLERLQKRGVELVRLHRSNLFGEDEET